MTLTTSWHTVKVIYSGLLSSVAPPFTDFAYVTSMSAAFNSLAMDYYHEFIWTVDINTVAIYCLFNGG